MEATEQDKTYIMITDINEFDEFVIKDKRRSKLTDEQRKKNHRDAQKRWREKKVNNAKRFKEKSQLNN